MKNIKTTAQQKPFYSKVKKEHVNQNLLDLVPTYESLSKDQKEFLTNFWLKSYAFGTKLVKDNIFTNNKLTTSQDLKERFSQYPDVKNQNLAFIKKVGEANEQAFEKILDEDANQDDFRYEIYESNYIDRSLDVIKSTSIPKGFEKIDISLVSQDAFAEGIMIKIDYLAKSALSILAKNQIENM